MEIMINKRIIITKYQMSVTKFSGVSGKFLSQRDNICMGW